MQIDKRYTMRLRNQSGFKGDDIIPILVTGEDDPLGVWDTVDKVFVKRDDATGKWVPET